MIWLLPNVVNKKIQGIINCQGGIISSLNFFYRCVGMFLLNGLFFLKMALDTLGISMY
jgi:hypothetical protein